ncbi:MAG: hypothetical protein IJU55_06595 [Selenomonadaceae bacterium]|nr:hypothetical protein [Selenomonadaceae bacterium]
MATIDRFKDALAIGKVLTDEETSFTLTAQMKYDYLAAVHTMDQLTNLWKEFDSRKKRRNALREKISDSCKMSLKKIAETEGVLTLKQVLSAEKLLRECHEELLKIESVADESDKLFKNIADGVSAGH